MIKVVLSDTHAHARARARTHTHTHTHKLQNLCNIICRAI